MTILFLSASTPASNPDSEAINPPAGISEGDLMLMQIRGLTEVPVGWELIPGTELYGVGSDAGVTSIWMRTVTASEPATYSATPTSGGLQVGIVAFTSDIGAPIGVDVADVQSNASSTDRTWPAITLTAAESMVVAFAHITANVGTVPPSGYTEHWDAQNPRLYCISDVISGAGSYGPLVAAASIAFSSTSHCAIVALSEGTHTPFEGPQYRGKSQTAYATVNGSVAEDVPDTLEVGDLMLASLSLSTDKTPTFPAGWEAIETITGTDNLYVYGKVAEAGDIGATITVTFAAGSVGAFLGIIAYFSPRGRVLAVDASDSQSNASSTDVTFPSVTPTADLLGMAYFAHLSNTFATSPDDRDAERWEVSSGARRAYAMTELWRDGGATGTRTATRSSAATSGTVTVAVRELPPECTPHAGYTYDGVDITDFCNAIEVIQRVTERERRTLGSTGTPFRAGLVASLVQLKGDWNATIDALLGRDAFLGVRRTGVATFDDCTMTVSYTWTDGVRVNSWKVTTAAPGKIEWSATLQNNVLGVRSVELD